MPLGAGHGRAPARIRWSESEDVPTSGLRHMPGLDGLRGLAVVAVLLYHGDALGGGYLGVDAFFVLSGFLITSLLLGEVARSGRVNLAAFWTRRARRLLPALFVVLLGVAVFASVLASSTDFERIRLDAFATLGYVANWHSVAQGHDYWSLFQAPSPLEHTWSLAIEEQFYVVWPLVVFAIAWLAARVRRRSDSGTSVARVVFFVTVGLAALSTSWMWRLYTPGGDTSRVYLGTDTRAASILMGAALAAWCGWRGVGRRGARARVALETVAIGAGALLMAAWATVDGESGFLYRGGFLLCGLCATAVIAAVAHPTEGPVARALSFAPLRGLGIISYGLYLWHWPVYVAMSPERMHLDGTELLAARIGVSLALAVASFVLIERPIRHGASITGWRLVVAVPTAVAICAVAIVGTTSGATKPVGATPLRPTVEPAAFVDGALAAAVSRHAPGTGRRILIVGDSVGVILGQAGEAVQYQEAVVVRKAASAGCLLAATEARGINAAQKVVDLGMGESCVPTWTEGGRTFRPNTVVFVYGNAAAFQDLSINGEWAGPCSGVYQTWYESQLQTQIAEFTNRGANVLLATLPHLVAHWAPPDAAQRIDCVNAMHAKVAANTGNVTVVDLAEFVCPAGQCRLEYESRPFRADGLHYTVESARYVVHWLLGEVQRADAVARSGCPTIEFW